MATFHAGGDDFFPNVGKLLYLRAKQIDPLTSGNLRIQPVLLRDLAQHDQFVGGDLASRNTGDDRIKSAPLDVGQKPVVCVLQGGEMPVDRCVVPEAGQDRGDGRLADFAAKPAAMPGEQGFK